MMFHEGEKEKVVGKKQMQRKVHKKCNKPENLKKNICEFYFFK